MATGGAEEIDLPDLTILSNEPLPDEAQETSFSDDKTEYNIGANLLDTSIFDPPPAKDPKLQVKEQRYKTNQDKLKKAIKNTEWKYTEEGLQRLSPRVDVDGVNIYYKPEGQNIYDKLSYDKKDLFLEKGLLKFFKNKHGEVKTYGLCLTKDGGEFYSVTTMLKKIRGKFCQGSR